MKKRETPDSNFKIDLNSYMRGGNLRFKGITV